MTRTRRHRGLGLFPALCALMLGGAGIDFASFANRTAKAIADPDVSADGIVALTGGSGLRIASGIKLVGQGKGERLLISGVHPDVTMKELMALAGGSEDTYACCVDIGYRAETTIGNATETADWARDAGYDSLIIVTSDYHLPRSMLLLQQAMPDTTLIAHPVRTRIDPSKIWSNPHSFRGVLTEWAKWRVTTFQ